MWPVVDGPGREIIGLGTMAPRRADTRVSLLVGQAGGPGPPPSRICGLARSDSGSVAHSSVVVRIASGPFPQPGTVTFECHNRAAKNADSQAYGCTLGARW
jgi:hypothetical protein